MYISPQFKPDAGRVILFAVSPQQLARIFNVKNGREYKPVSEIEYRGRTIKACA
jgi:hypothetical protein